MTLLATEVIASLQKHLSVDEEEMASKVTGVGGMTAQLNRSTAAVESLVGISQQNHRLKVLKESKLATEQQLAMLKRLGRQDSGQYKTSVERFLSLLQLIGELADAQVTGNNDHASKPSVAWDMKVLKMACVGKVVADK